jgi:hypothetical protein
MRVLVYCANGLQGHPIVHQLLRSDHQVRGPQAWLHPPATKPRALGRSRKAAGLSRQTVYRIKDDPAACEAALTAWGI